MNNGKYILQKIRRKAYNMNNPVQAKRSSGHKRLLLYRLNYVAVQPATGLREEEVRIFTPSCASLARGYQYLRPTVLHTFIKKIDEFQLKTK